MSRIEGLGSLDAARATRPVTPRVVPRGVPPALHGHEVLATESPVVARGFLDALLGRTRLAVDGPVASFHATVHAVTISSLTIAHIDVRGATTIDVPATGEAVTVHVHTYGMSMCAVGPELISATSTRAVVASPRTRLRIGLDADASQLIVRIDRERVEQTLSRMIGGRITRAIAFDPVLDLTEPHALRWNIAMQLLSAELMTPGSLLSRGAGVREVEDLLISSLILLQPSNYSDELPTRTGRKGIVSIALDYIDRHLAEPLTTASIAAEVHLAPRTIQQAFAEAFAMTPTEYVRNVRLERVHADLQAASLGDGVSVAAAAQRWGFTHLGEFSVRYRRRFGQTPSQTLRGA